MFNSRTRLIILNTPNNPLGKVSSSSQQNLSKSIRQVFTLEELEHIANLCQKHNVICIADEVYEWITYARPHIRIATLPNMWQRTLTIGSAGKTFSSTGLKIGWTIGPENLVRLCRIVHQVIKKNFTNKRKEFLPQNCVYICPTLSQEVVARCLEYELTRLNSPECYFYSISREFQEKRDRFARVLHECGMKPIIPDGGYFMLADFSRFGSFEKLPSIVQGHVYSQLIILNFNLINTI